uniref:CMP/dCMP-type deaminase domain-containing protein n=1 Tax=Ditylum brightwellii TaxID=49249 RepID=A0A7S4RRL6_9STRA
MRIPSVLLLFLCSTHGFVVPPPSSSRTRVSFVTSEKTCSSVVNRDNVGLRMGTLAESGDLKNATATDVTTAVAEKEEEAEEEEEEVNGTEEETDEEEEEEEEELTEEQLFDMEMMRKAIQLAQSAGGERGANGPFPRPIGAAILVNADNQIIGTGRSDYNMDAVQAAISSAGISATPLREWCVSWPNNPKLRRDIASSTLYVTLEPTADRQGEALPPMTQLIMFSGIKRVVIGCQDPVKERTSKGAALLHGAGISVSMGILQEECENLISEYSKLTNSKLHAMARKHFRKYQRPLGFLHCSVVETDCIAAFARHGNAFGKDFGGKTLSYRDFGSYELAPPPESIWAAPTEDNDDFEHGIVDDWEGSGVLPEEEEDDDDFEHGIDDAFIEFEEEEWEEGLNRNPMMPWYEQVDACVATFPKEGNGPADDQSVTSRLNGLKWLATHGKALPAGVERVLVMDATNLCDLPLSNDDPMLPKGVDVEEFWMGQGRKPTKVLLRHGDNAQALAAANAAAEAAAAAARAAQAAKNAIESGDAEEAAQAAIDCQDAALSATSLIQGELQATQDLKQRLLDMGVVVEVMRGGDPIDVMAHLGRRNGYKAVVWRAGCWGSRGVQSILKGAFQWVSAHLAVDAKGGKFWQLMLAERAVQAACGPEQKVKIFSEQEDLSLVYCDEDDADSDCVMTVDGRPIRHVRLDCRVALVDESKHAEVFSFKTKPIEAVQAEGHKEEAPWFI